MRKYTIDYACLSAVGKVRRNNEDNFYCDGHLREDLYSNEDEAYAGAVSSQTNELFAVFDGMGGEALGEVAAFVAASHTQQFCQDRTEYEEYLYELAGLLNDKVKEECEARSLVLMGTTCAMVQFGDRDIYVLNAGDSRIYRISKHEITRVSTDHIAVSYRGRALTKFLGLPGDDPLSPYIAMGAYKAGDIYLLCTDGVSDMLSDDEILKIVDRKGEPAALVRELIDSVMEKGGVDNATAILCRIHR